VKCQRRRGWIVNFDKHSIVVELGPANTLAEAFSSISGQTPAERGSRRDEMVEIQ